MVLSLTKQEGSKRLTTLAEEQYMSYSDTVSLTMPMEPKAFCAVISFYTLSSNYYTEHISECSLPG